MPNTRMNRSNSGVGPHFISHAILGFKKTVFIPGKGRSEKAKSNYRPHRATPISKALGSDPDDDRLRKIPMIMERRLMLQTIIVAVTALILMFAIDMVWLGWLGRGFYLSEIGTLVKESPDLPSAAAFYVLYALGMTIFVLLPAIEAGSITRAIVYGALFGLVAYGTYDLTNLAVMKGFTAKIALIDLAWGTVLTAVVSGLSVRLTTLFFN